MINFYVNHICLENTNEDLLKSAIFEITEKIKIIDNYNCSIKVSPNFWSTEIRNGLTLLDFLNTEKSDETLTILRIFVDKGPFYDLPPEEYDKYHELKIHPDITNNKIRNFFIDNYINKNNDILNVKDFNELIYSEYKIEDTHSIYTHSDPSKIKKYILSKNIPKNINEVFDYTEKNFKNIIILPSAKTSSKRHNFQNSFGTIINAFAVLNEYNRLSCKSINEKQKIFKQKCQLEISPESEKTLKIARYKKERIFKIKGNPELFEWHVKIGHHTRIHYFYDDSTKITYIGHIGKHLGTATYNS